MLAAWRAAGGEVAVIGLGRSGLAACRLLARGGVRVYASDAGAPSADASAAGEALRGSGVEVEWGGHDLARIAAATAVVLSPGVPPDAPPVMRARAAGLPVVAEAALGLAELKGTRVIAITGTNGKTTTTALTAHALAQAGLDIVVAGNIGTAVCDVALAAAPPAWLALELSSFQLHDMPDLAPDVGVLTNLSPNHLDRYASLAEYYGDKALLFRNATAASRWVVNGDDPAVREMVAGVAGTVRRFSIRGRADAWHDQGQDMLMVGDTPVLSRAALPLLGDHNVANALAVLLAADGAGVPPVEAARGMTSFVAIPHRVEPVAEVDGVLWINDSKSTNITSTEVAVAALDRPFVLLLGGRHKGAPYTTLAPALATRCRAVVAYGEARPIIEADLGGTVRVVGAGSFPEVLAVAAAEARPGDAVLLSPACSSYDMFRNYEERGDTFRAAVRAMA